MMEHVIDVSYQNEQDEAAVPPDLVEGRLLAILDAIGIKENVEFSVTFVDDESIKDLNRTYRDKDEPTDILTFVQSDGDVAFPDARASEHARMLGYMVISLTSMRANADRFGVSPDEELYRLLVHGVLHLLGGDHKTNDPSEPMLQKQEAILRVLRGAAS
jgi:probable rRNA maturation factor